MTDNEDQMKTKNEKVGKGPFNKKMITEEYHQLRSVQAGYAHPRFEITCDVFAKNLSEIAQGKIPIELQRHMSKPEQWTPDKLLEIAVAQIFRITFFYNTIPLGSATPFRCEPDGLVYVDSPIPFAFLYDCKSTIVSDSYQMDSKDEGQYVRYIKDKKTDLSDFFKLFPLTHFVIVAPDFSGNVDLRIRNVEGKAGVIPVFIRAQTVSLLHTEASKLQPSRRRMINLGNIFQRGLTSDEAVRREINRVIEHARTYGPFGIYA